MALHYSCGGRTHGSRMRSWGWNWIVQRGGAAARPMGLIGTTSVAGTLLLLRWERWRNYFSTFGWLSQQCCGSDILVGLAGRSCQCCGSHPYTLVKFHCIGSDTEIWCLRVSRIVVCVAAHWSFILVFCSSLDWTRLSFHQYRGLPFGSCCLRLRCAGTCRSDPYIWCHGYCIEK